MEVYALVLARLNLAVIRRLIGVNRAIDRILNEETFWKAKLGRDWYGLRHKRIPNYRLYYLVVIDNEFGRVWSGNSRVGSFDRVEKIFPGRTDYLALVDGSLYNLYSDELVSEDTVYLHEDGYSIYRIDREHQLIKDIKGKKKDRWVIDGAKQILVSKKGYQYLLLGDGRVINNGYSEKIEIYPDPDDIFYEDVVQFIDAFGGKFGPEEELLRLDSDGVLWRGDDQLDSGVLKVLPDLSKVYLDGSHSEKQSPVIPRAAYKSGPISTIVVGIDGKIYPLFDEEQLLIDQPVTTPYRGAVSLELPFVIAREIIGED